MCLSVCSVWKDFEDKGAHPCPCSKGPGVVVATSSCCLSWIRELARKETRLVFSPQPQILLSRWSHKLCTGTRESLTRSLRTSHLCFPRQMWLCVCAWSHHCNGKRNNSSSRGKEQNKIKLLWGLWLFKYFFKTPFSGCEPWDRCFILLANRSSSSQLEGYLWLWLSEGWQGGRTSWKTAQKGKGKTAIYSDALSWVPGVIAACVCNSSQDWFRYILVVSQLCHSQCCSAAQLLTRLCTSGSSCLIQDWPEWIQIHPNWLTKLMNFPCNWLHNIKLTLSRTVWAPQAGRAGTSCCSVSPQSSQTLRVA